MDAVDKTRIDWAGYRCVTQIDSTHEASARFTHHDGSVRIVTVKKPRRGLSGWRWAHHAGECDFCGPAVNYGWSDIA